MRLFAKSRRVKYLLGIIAILVVVSVIGVFPTLYRQFGFHPEQDTLEWMSLPTTYLGTSRCKDCHESEHTQWANSVHQTVNCESCHGPAGAHVEGKDRLAMQDSTELCPVCHTRLVSRPSDFPQVDIEEMREQAECITCHNPHDPRAGIPPQVSHALEERTECQLCHVPHEPWVMIPPQVPHTLEGRTECQLCHAPYEPLVVMSPQIPHTLEGRNECLVCHDAEGIEHFPKDHVGRRNEQCLGCHTTK